MCSSERDYRGRAQLNVVTNTFSVVATLNVAPNYTVNRATSHGLLPIEKQFPTEKKIIVSFKYPNILLKCIVSNISGRKIRKIGRITINISLIVINFSN